MKYAIYLFFILICSYSLSQNEEQKKIRIQIENLATKQKGLNESVSISVTEAPIQDFLSAIAAEHGLNISVDQKLNIKISNNFTNAPVTDVIMFLVQQYDLTIEFIGDIMFFKEKPEIIVEEKPKTKEIQITYRTDNTFTTANLKNDTLFAVAKILTQKSGKNVVASPKARNKIVSAYVENRPFESALKIICETNGLLAVYNNMDDYYYIDIKESEVASQNANTRGNRNNRNQKKTNYEITTLDDETISVFADNVPIVDLIKEISQKLDKQYFFYDLPEGNTSLKVKNAKFKDVMSEILRGTEYTFKAQKGYFLFGKRNQEGLRSTELIKLENRTIEQVIDLIPAELKKNVDLKEFIEQNGIVASGSYIRIQEIKEFLKEVDIVVPVVQIDVMIFSYNKSHTVETGIDMGIGEQPVTTNGTLLPSLNMNFGADAINGLINSFNGFGFLNLGAVNPNFYVTLKAMENNSIIDIQSTPKIATLNGHEASIKVGEQSWYFQIQNQVLNNSVNQNILSSGTWQQIEANLELTIKPFVSLDEHVTLEISLTQKDFTGKESPQAPNNTSTKEFKSEIRVKNGEMILMGGLEEKEKVESGNGIPLLSRIPIIKWFTSNRSKKKSQSKLHIFIKPTIIY